MKKTSSFCKETKKETDKTTDKATEGWWARLDQAAFFSSEEARDKALYTAARHRNAPFRLVAGDGFKCCAYDLSLNIFTFGKAVLRLPFTIIGPPASVDQTGFYGSLGKLADYYTARKGNHLALNLPAPLIGRGVCAQTLSTAVLFNTFKDFDDYMAALRSPYRRRIRLAQSKISGLFWEQLPSGAFDDSLYALYLQVLAKSDFPLETLGVAFFRSCPGTIFVLRANGRPLAFVLLEHREGRTDFLLGGMDYAQRDARDLYMNMLVKVVEEGIGHGSGEIHLGQTAEESKCRLGAILVPRYMLYLSSSRWRTALARFLMKRVAYREPARTYHVFRESAMPHPVSGESAGKI